MPSLRKLPRSVETWCVDVRDVGFLVDGEPVPVGLVATQAGEVLSASPVLANKMVREMLEAACFQPGSGTTPRRPKALLCGDAALARRVRRVFKGLGVQVSVATDLSRLDVAFRDLAGSLSASEDLGLEAHLAEWRPLVRRLWEAAPWDALPEGTRIVFEDGAGLDDQVLLVTGAQGQDIGLALFADEDEVDAFEAAVILGHGADAEMWPRLVLLSFDGVDECGAARAQAAEDHGVLLPGAVVPWILATEGRRRIPVEPDDERRLRTAAAALLDLIHSRPDVATLGPRSSIRHRSSARGEAVQLRLEVPDDPDDIIDFDHQLFMATSTTPDGEEQPAVIIKAAKADIERLARAIGDTVELLVADEGGGPRLWTVAEDGSMEGSLGGRLAPESLAWLQGHDAVLFVLSAGGAKRQSLRGNDFVFEREVALTWGL